MGRSLSCNNRRWPNPQLLKRKEAIQKHALQPETMKQGVGLLSGTGTLENMDKRYGTTHVHIHPLLKHQNMSFEMDYPGEPTTPDSNKPEGCMVVTHSNNSNNAAVVSTLQYVDRCPVIDGIDNSITHEASARSDDEGCWVVIRDGNTGEYGEKNGTTHARTNKKIVTRSQLLSEFFH